VDDHLLKIFQTELGTQCEFILIGGRQVNAYLEVRQSQPIWFALQGMLVSAANASKLLWGSRTEEALEVRRQLRESVGVTDESPLSSRRLRNDFEHFDERLERWFGQSQDHNYIGRNIGDPEGIVVVGRGVPDDKFGHFDPSTTIVSFWEQSASLRDIVSEAERIIAVLQDLGMASA
jgi:hypothetical protein